MSVKDLAKMIQVLPNALYRLMQKLINRGLITMSGKHPGVYRVISPSFAFEGLVAKRISELELVKDNIINNLSQIKNTDQTRIDLLKSAYEFFLTYCQLAKEARKEILIISIGEPLSDEVLLANRDALERGVTIKFICHKNNVSNRDLLKRWQRIGLQIKHYPDWGFHLVVVDRVKSILSVNNPERTNERTALVIYSKGLAKAHADYFYATWKKAGKIT